MLPAAIALLMSAPHAWAGTIRLLVLGDSLAAGYGLAHADGFEAQLEARRASLEEAGDAAALAEHVSKLDAARFAGTVSQTAPSSASAAP